MLRLRTFVLLLVVLLSSLAVSAQTPNHDRVRQALCAARSTDDFDYWYEHISADPIGFDAAWPYWVHRIEIGDGAGKAPPCVVVPPPPPLPPIDTIGPRLDALQAALYDEIHATRIAVDATRTSLEEHRAVSRSLYDRALAFLKDPKTIILVAGVLAGRFALPGK